MQGGRVLHPGEKPFPQNTLWIKNINRFLYPALITPEELRRLISFDHWQLYNFAQQYVRPWICAGGPRGGRRWVQYVNYSCKQGFIKHYSTLLEPCYCITCSYMSYVAP